VGGIPLRTLQVRAATAPALPEIGVTPSSDDVTRTSIFASPVAEADDF